MLVGTADLQTLAVSAPSVPAFRSDTVTLAGVEVFQACFEMRAASRERPLPSGLHPTNPATWIVLAWRCAESPWGPFSLVQLRIGCRSGVRTRGFVCAAACDAAVAARELAACWGFPTRAARIMLSRRYDGCSLAVATVDATSLAIEAQDPDPLAPDDVQYTGTLTLARTPRGLRLVQLEPRTQLERAERLRPRLERFDAAAWGHDALTPYHPVSASIGVGRIEIPPVRFVCRPDVLAFQGTESVAATG
ncbi:MAG TPA: hypothetical protein VMS55_09970 [Myxococcota bacterium]|nr:hypothetical protein [Myxococcota bacterium]